MSAHRGPRFPIRLRGRALTGRARPILRTGSGRSRPSRSDGAQGPGSTTSHHHLTGAMAQLVAHLLCKQGVTGSSPVGSTAFSLSSSALPPGLPLPPSLRASPYRPPQGSSARFERGQVLSSAAVSAAPSVCSPGVGGDAPGLRPLFPARLAPSLGKSRRPSIHPSLDRLPCPWGVDSMVSSGPALCEVGQRGLSADGFRRAGLALCEAGWISLSGPGLT